MQKNKTARLIFAALVFSQPLHSKPSECANVILPDLCEQLGAISNETRISFQVGLKSDPPDSTSTDPSKDTIAIHQGGTSKALEEVTKRLFESYDLRWTEDTSQRASVPQQAERSYKVFATKVTVLAISQESYVVELQRWSPSIPSGLRNRNSNANPNHLRPMVNAKGQLIDQEVKTDRDTRRIWFRLRQDRQLGDQP